MDERQTTDQTSGESGICTSSSTEAKNMFLAHLERASKLVQTWPAWKQHLLGRIESQTTAEGQPRSVSHEV